MKYVLRSMPELQPGARSVVSRISGANLVTPRLGRLDVLTSRAGSPPNAVTVKATEGDTSKGRAGSNEIGVSAGEGLGHHRSRRCAGGEHLGRVNIVVGNGETDDAGDTKGVTSTVVCESGRKVDIPAAIAARRRLGVNNNKALVLVREVSPLGAGEVGLGGATTVVHGNNEGGSRDWVIGLVNPSSDAGGVGTEVGELGNAILGSEDANGVQKAGGEELEEEGHPGNGYQWVVEIC